MNRPARTKLSERRRDVANYALKGWKQKQSAIARLRRIPLRIVSRDLAAAIWRTATKETTTKEIRIRTIASRVSATGHYALRHDAAMR